MHIVKPQLAHILLEKYVAKKNGVKGRGEEEMTGREYCTKLERSAVERRK